MSTKIRDEVQRTRLLLAEAHKKRAHDSAAFIMRGALDRIETENACNDAARGCDHPPAADLTDLWCSSCRVLKLAGRVVEAPRVTTSADVIRGLLVDVTPREPAYLTTGRLLRPVASRVHACHYCGAESLATDAGAVNVRPMSVPLPGLEESRTLAMLPWDMTSIVLRTMVNFRPSRLVLAVDAPRGALLLRQIQVGMELGLAAVGSIPVECFAPCDKCAGDEPDAARAALAIQSLPAFLCGQDVLISFHNDSDRPVRILGGYFAGRAAL